MFYFIFFPFTHMCYNSSNGYLHNGKLCKLLSGKNDVVWGLVFMNHHKMHKSIYNQGIQSSSGSSSLIVYLQMWCFYSSPDFLSLPVWDSHLAYTTTVTDSSINIWHTILCQYITSNCFYFFFFLLPIYHRLRGWVIFLYLISSFKGITVF